LFHAQRTTTSRLATGAAVGLLALASLSGCALVQTAPPAALTGVAACAQGKTWNLDVPALGTAVQAELATRNIVATVVAEGSQSLSWTVEGKIEMQTDYTLTITSGTPEAQTIVVDKHTGPSTGIAYVNAEVAIPRNWDASDLEHTTTATVAGATPEELPYTLTNTDIDDSVGVELTCDGGTMTTHQRGSDLTLNWTS